MDIKELKEIIHSLPDDMEVHRYMQSDPPRDSIKVKEVKAIFDCNGKRIIFT